MLPMLIAAAALHTAPKAHTAPRPPHHATRTVSVPALTAASLLHGVTSHTAPHTAPHAVPGTPRRPAHTALAAAHRTAGHPHSQQHITTDNYGLYDSTTPSSIGSGKNRGIYSNGAYAATSADATGPHTLWIDTNGSDPHANVLDVEPGDASPSQAGPWAAAAHQAHPQYPVIIYTMLSNYGAVQSSVNSSAPHANVKYWIADPTGSPHMVGGATATQWSWGQSTDISSVNSNLWTP